MHKVRTPWPVATRVQYIVAFEECRRRWPRLSARCFCSVAEVPYPTFVRWVVGPGAGRGSGPFSTAPDVHGAALLPSKAAYWTSSATPTSGPAPPTSTGSGDPQGWSGGSRAGPAS
jgi:hypothetical protein